MEGAQDQESRSPKLFLGKFGWFGFIMQMLCTAFVSLCRPEEYAEPRMCLMAVGILAPSEVSFALGQILCRSPQPPIVPSTPDCQARGSFLGLFKANCVTNPSGDSLERAFSAHVLIAALAKCLEGDGLYIS